MKAALRFAPLLLLYVALPASAQERSDGAAAQMRLSINDDTPLGTGDTAILTGTATLTGGRVPEGRVTITLPPAMAGASIRSYRIGDAVTCDTDPEPIIEGDEAILSLDGCTVEMDAPAEDRTLTLSVSAALADAPPGASPGALADWRALSAYLGLWSGDTLLEGRVVDTTMVGPRFVTTATLPERSAYRVGDDVILAVTLENRGDQAVTAPRLTLTNPESFRCEGAEVVGADKTFPCKDNVILLPDIDADSTAEVSVTLRLRRDALVTPQTGPAFDLTAKGLAPRTLPVPALRMALHDAPSLRVVDSSAWREQGSVFAATIGDTGRLRLNGTLPPGRYRGSVALLARVVDARTGAPVGPAALSVADPTLSINTLDGDSTGEKGEFTVATGAVWAQHILPFDLTEATDQADQNRRFNAVFDVSLADEPSIAAGYLVEITAETTAYEIRTAPADLWVELLVQEPELRLKLFSLDEDRTILPDEPFGALSLACNYGDSAAFGTAMTLETPPAVALSAKGARIRGIAMPLDAVRTGSMEEIDADIRILDDNALSVEAGSITLDRRAAALPPDECVGIELRAPLMTDRSETMNPAGAAVTSLQEYSGIRIGDDDDEAEPQDPARRYPGARTAPLRFEMPLIDLSPSATLQIGAGRQIEHAVELTVPDNLGNFRVALSPQSSTRLNWEVLEKREDAVMPWQSNARPYPPGTTIGLVMRTTTPERLPLGWVDTSRLEAEILTDEGIRLDATLRLVLRSGTAPAIGTDKLVALDRNCDGELADEEVQDAVFEPVKDATLGDCVIVRIGFENVGRGPVEKIIIRDAISARTTLLPDSAIVRIAPEPLDSVREPDPSSGVLEWEFRGLFRAGAVGEVEYRLRLDPQ